MPINLIKDPWWKRPKTKLWVAAGLPVLAALVIAFFSLITGLCILGTLGLLGYCTLKDAGQAWGKKK